MFSKSRALHLSKYSNLLLGYPLKRMIEIELASRKVICIVVEHLTAEKEKGEKCGIKGHC